MNKIQEQINQEKALRGMLFSAWAKYRQDHTNRTAKLYYTTLQLLLEQEFETLNSVVQYELLVK